ncbi:hypothetical protein ACFE04_018735 [Oxalis oulophora]
MASSSEKLAVRGGSEKSSSSSSFSQKCSLLSQYLKENGSFGDLNLTCSVQANAGIMYNHRPHPATTMNLFPLNHKKTNAPTGISSRDSKCIQFFPQQTSTEIIPAHSSMVKPSVNEPEAAQMTIFYGGQVIVLNDLPAHKAREIIALASNGSSQSHVASYPLNNAVISSNMAKNLVGPSRAAPPSSSAVPNFVNNMVQPTEKTIGGDLPIARRVSLHRFLEKRKDRINSKAPYLINSPVASSARQDESPAPWFSF